MFRIKSHTHQRHLEGKNKTLVYTGIQGKESWPPQETKPDLLLSVLVSPVEAWVISGLLWGQGL